ncbi:ELWxxDGT repeat protein, partial [Microcystis aeruginosa]|uniref:ELWxxDGT repeat protein n=1 Tax=Microcystis aeruginosa TaxID=1126 RepID=UPI0020B12A4A
MSTPFLVKDINPGSSGSFLGNLTARGNTLFFTAYDSVNGEELWRSDGTAAGTVLVKDIVPSFYGSSSRYLTAVGSTLFFTADDRVNGTELWKSDGTAAGTVLVKDIFPGLSGPSPRNLTAVGSTLFFTADDNNDGQKLWKSDGTAAGTVLVKDISPTSNLTAVGSTLFFRAFDSVNGTELWKSDGTAAGTVLVKDIFPGSFSSNPGNLTALGNTLFFTAFDVNGTELWKSDGTAAGTVLVKDIRPGSYTSSNPFNLTAVGNTLTLYFTADDGVNGTELWKSDGTAAGTVLVRDIRAGSSSSSLENLTAVGSTLFFTVDDGVNGKELWKSDGTAAGTVLVRDIRAGSSSSNPRNLTAVGNTLFFTAFDGVNGEELWRSDGTAAGTVLVADTRPGASSSDPSNLRAVGSTLFFSADNGVNGAELWAVSTPAIPTLAIAATNASQTEGNSGSKAFTFTVTRSVITTGSNNVDWAVISSGSNPANAADFVGGLFPSGTVSFAPGETSKVITVNVLGDTTFEPNENFTVILSNPTNGANITTATAIGTIQNDDVAIPILTIAATNANQTEGNSGSKAFTFTVTRADNTTGSNNVNWAVTGTGTFPANAADFVGGVLPSGVVSFAPGESSKVITVNVQGDTTIEPNENFTVTLSNPTNGATLGTPSTATLTIVDEDSVPFLVKDIYPGSFGPYPSNLTARGNTLFFTAYDSVNGEELWRSDGTAAGTVAVADINPGDYGSYPGNLTVVGSTLFFQAYDSVNGTELWKSDGTAAGTVLVKDINPGDSSSFLDNLTALGNTLFFTNAGLWKSDGTAAGTVLVKNISLDNLTAVGNTLFFSASGVSGTELWKSDGTAAGTVLVKNIRPGSSSSDPRNLTAVGNTLFFTANDGANGRELWKSDGTAAGTVLVKDIGLGSSYFPPSYLTAVGNTLFFSANDNVNGRELWKSDGTAAGTVLVKDIRPGPGDSLGFFTQMTAVGNTLFFTAFDSVNGTELWKSDGTEAGTVLVKDINPGYDNPFIGLNPQNLTAVGNTLFFTADDGVNGRELWKSDGTAAGTILVGDIRPGSSSSDPQNLRVVGSTLYFTADNGVNGEELWAVSTPAIPTLAIAATSASQTEGNSGSKAFTFTVTRSVNTTGTNNVNWVVTGTGTNPANATDFVGGLLPSGTLSFAAGETSKVITVDVQGDTTVELNENFTVTLSNATNGATITTATATGTIENDDISVTPIEAFGNTKLVQDATNKLYAQIGNNNPTAIKIGATQITTNIYPGWQTLAAETVNGVNQVLWKYNDGNYLHLWTLDSNWNWQSSTGWWGLNSTEAFTQETNFQQDFNGDGIIGQPYTPMETFGNTKLVQDATNNLYAQIGNNNPTAIKIGATQITTNIYSGWQTLAAETVNGVNQVLWKYNDGNYLHLWTLDSNWNWQSSTGWWGLNSPEAFTQETNFQ